MQEIKPVHAILQHAVATGAERICFLVHGRYAFAGLDAEAIDSVLEQRPARYKLQVKRDGRWADVSKYMPASPGAQALDDIREGDLESALRSTPDEIGNAANGDPRSLVRAVRGLSRLLADSMAGRGTVSASKARDVLDSIGTRVDSPHVRYLQGIADLYVALLAFPAEDLLSGELVESAVGSLEARINADPERYSSSEGKSAAATILGKLLSNTDRTSAARHFRRAREGNNSTVIRDLYIDMGVMTYFDEAEVENTQNPVDPVGIRGSIRPVTNIDPQNPTGVLVSVDPRFFRIYGPLLYFYAQQMPDIDYTILLCGPDDEVHQAISDGADFGHALNVLNRSGLANIHFYSVALPSIVPEPKTFYASARFFAAQMMLERYPSVYLMDADLTTDVDPRPFFQRIADVPFAGPAQKNFTALSPWRRYMAGNIHLSRSILNGAMLNDLQRYLAAGLSQCDSWMLDQNALAYAIERNHSDFTDLSIFDRPFTPPRFRSVWEKSFSR